MEAVKIRLADDALYDELVHSGLRDNADLTVVTKDHATEAGRPAVCLSFTVEMPDKSFKRVQTVVTGRLFAGICAAFRGRYGNEGDQVCTADKVN